MTVKPERQTHLHWNNYQSPCFQAYFKMICAGTLQIKLSKSVLPTPLWMLPLVIIVDMAIIGVLRKFKKRWHRWCWSVLYKAYILSYLEYCSPLLQGKDKIWNSKLKSAEFFWSEYTVHVKACTYRLVLNQLQTPQWSWVKVSWTLLNIIVVKLECKASQFLRKNKSPLKGLFWTTNTDFYEVV